MPPKRPLAATRESELTPKHEDDEEDVAGPSNSAMLKTAVAAFAYSAGPSTRSASKRLKVEVKEETLAVLPATPLKKRKLDVKPSPSPSPRKQKPIQMELDIPHATPKNWEKVYSMIKEMRKDVVAPVDTMGCASAMAEEIDPKASLIIFTTYSI